MNDPTVVVVFRSGWRQPLDGATGFEVWDQSSHRGTIPGELVLQLLMHYLRGVALSEHLRTRLATPPQPVIPVTEVPTMPLAKATPRLRGTHDRKLRGRA